MALIHVRRERHKGAGRDSWRLLDPHGQAVTMFDEFCARIADYPFATKNRYAIVVSRFIDYLYEVQVLGAGPVSRSVVNQAIDYYLLLLRDGDGITLTRIGTTQVGNDDDLRREQQLRGVARRLGIKPLAPASWSNTLAALNRFLRLCELLAQEAHEIALVHGGIASTLIDRSFSDYMPFLLAVDHAARLSPQQVNHIKQASMLGSVIRFRGDELERPRGLRTPNACRTNQQVYGRDFPLEYLPALLDALTSWRDRALVALVAASGLRRSEGLNTENAHIDIERQLVYVLDPYYRRYGRDLPESERVRRFKGRAVSWTYMREPYRTWFFEFLEQYRKHEYVVPADGNDFVFQMLRHPYRGRPLREAADSTLNDLFCNAVRRAQIPGPPGAPDHEWTIHSLRHAYAMYMLNEFPVPGQLTPGLTETEVQLLMGHIDIAATRRYARPSEKHLLAKLAARDQQLLTTDDVLAHLPPPIAARLTAAHTTSRSTRYD